MVARGVSDLVLWIGHNLIAMLRFFGGIVLLNNRTLAGIFRGRFSFKDTMHQMAHIGIESVPIVAVTMTFSGMVLAYHAAIQVGRLGTTGLVGWLVAETITRELGPALSCIVISARAGSAMTAELGTMKVTEQIDALRSMAVNPVDYLVAPRYVACFVMVPIIVLIGDVIGVSGGYFLSLFTHQINSQAYLANIPGNLELWTVFAGIIKSYGFAVIIAIVACYEGLSCEMSADEVGRATTRSVVYCIMLIFAANLILTTFLFPA